MTPPNLNAINVFLFNIFKVGIVRNRTFAKYDIVKILKGKSEFEVIFYDLKKLAFALSYLPIFFTFNDY